MSSTPAFGRDVRLAAAGALLLLFALTTLTYTDSDLWGHTRFGLDMLRDHELPADDPYSFTQDKPWVNHEWLAELQMGIAYSLGGPAGLALLKGAFTFTALVLLWGAMRGIDLGPRIVLFGLTVTGAASVMRALRPQVWSLLLLVILCRILVEDRRRARWWIPVLFALWANLHGGWIVGFGILVVWTLGDLAVRRRGSLVVIALLSCLATLLTPYGWRLWEFLLQTVRLGRDITEWRPLFEHSPADWVPWIAAVGGGVWLLGRPNPFRLHVIGILAMLAFASFRVTRIVPLFVACAGVLLSPWLLARWPASPAARPGAVRNPPPDQRLVAAALFVAALLASGFVLSKSLTCVRTVDRIVPGMNDSWVPDRDAASILMHAPPGRLVTFFNWGEYAIWHFGPRLRVSMDGRRETVYTDRRLIEHDAIVRGTELAFSTLAEWQAEYVWLPSRSAATRAWLLANGYRIDKETVRSFVAVRRDLPALTVTTGKSPAGVACFPD